jgi:two-component system cell cycle sensor histidine kinase/response regulator CckA
MFSMIIYGRTLAEDVTLSDRLANTVSAGGIMRQILIIDDDDFLVALLETIFTSLGYEVSTAYDGEEGMELFNGTHKYDMIVTDITMPRMDGNEVARRIRSSDKPDVPIIAMSGYDNKADKELFTLSIEKPFHLQALKDVIEKFN